MTVVLDKPLCCGAVTVAALSRVRVLPHGGPGGAVVAGSKDPVAVLIRQGGEISAFAPDGTALTAAEVEALCPGAMARFLAAADAGADADSPAASARAGQVDAGE